MPLSDVFDKRGLVERVRRVRRMPLAAYGIAVGAVAAATAIRWLLGDQILAGVPFITFFPAIIVATMIGGLGPGLVALALSSLAAAYLFLPPYMSWMLEPQAARSLLLFVALAAFNIGIVMLLDLTLDIVEAREQTVRVLIEAAPNGIVVVDEQMAITLVNAATERLFGYGRGELLGRNLDLLLPARIGAAQHDAIWAYRRHPEPRWLGRERKLTGRRKDGSEFPVEIGLSPIERGGRTSVLATVVDISEQRRAQEQQQVLVDELQHRSQNLFAVIHSVATRSLQTARSLEEAKVVLSGRLMALSRAHRLLAEAAWQGTALGEILAQECAAFGIRPSVTGCDVVVNPQAAQQFAMIIHELVTNSVKHGALSVPDGRVAIRGEPDSGDGEELYRFEWKESAGPPVSAPARRGFGSAILLDAAGHFARRAALDYAPGGVSYELRIPLREIEVRAGQAEGL